MTTPFIELYDLTDADDCDPDPIYYATADADDKLRSGLVDAMGDLTLELLFNDADMGHDVHNVRNADNDVIAIAYVGRA
ncbi:hypothetical protein Q9Q75_25710 [Mycobacterium intracellulare]|uniref:hypothetical protein n=1 Tax=Mycobacterium intracellulare TaxID=1767 RepID=UPI003355A1FB